MDTSVYCRQGPKSIPAIKIRGVLSGYRFVFKDLFDVKGYVTGAGNPTWLKSHQPAIQTSPIITQLLKQGAYCSGRVQTSELAYGFDGVNAHYGTAINSLAPKCQSGGSSSCSAAIISGDSDFALGIDTAGEIRISASYCGLFGLRATYSALPLEHSFSLAKSFDTASILSRNISVMDNVVTALFPEQSPVEQFEDAFIFVEKSVLALMDPQVKEELTNKLNKLARNRYVVSTDSLLDICTVSFEELGEWFSIIQGYELIQEHRVWLEEHQTSVAKDVSRRIDQSKNITKVKYAEAKLKAANFSTLFIYLLKSKGGWLCLPTTPGLPPELKKSFNSLTCYRKGLLGMTALASLCGLPQLHLPLGKINGKPYGLSLIGLPNSEKRLIKQGQYLLQSLAVNEGGRFNVEVHNR
ncbi:MAG: amidase [Psychromonas sp.]|jgi:amidase|uniref:amidase family protein n=1 Tax=Psychromonas sp. TaxID=1884585 RepID=UPI0039E22849